MEIASLEVRISASMDAATASISRLENQLGSLDSTLRRTSNLVPRLSFNGLNQVSKSAATKLNNVAKKLSVFGTQTKTAAKSADTMASSLAGVYVKLKAVTKAFSTVGSSIKSSMDYSETFNYWNVALDKIGNDFGKMYKQFGYDSAESYAASFSEKLKELNKKMTGYEIGDSGELMMTDNIGLGIDVSQLMDFQARIMSVSNSMGVLGDVSINTTKALSMLSADYSSLFNKDLKTVMSNFQSGLIGQSRAMYSYGIDITNATLQTEAYRIGLSKAVSEMTQAEKMQLRVIAMLRQSAVAWGDQANTMMSVSNQYRLLKQQISDLGRIIGNLFLPIIKTVMPYVNAFVTVLRRLFSVLGFKLFGDNWLKDLQSGIGGGAGTFEGLEEGAEDLQEGLDNASGAAKKLNKQIRAFDELNVITMPEETTGAKIGGGGGIGGIDLSGDIADALAEYEAEWNKAYENMENRTNETAGKILRTLKDLFKPISSAWAAEGEYIIGAWSEAFKNIGSLAKTVWKDFMSVWQQDATTKIFEDILHIAGDIGQVAANLSSQFEKAWSKNETGKHILEGIRDILAIITGHIREAADATVVWSENLDFSPLLSTALGYVNSLKPVVDALSGVLTDFYINVLLPLGKWTIEEGLPDLIKVFEDFNNLVDWEALRNNLAELWKHLEPFAERVGEGLIIFIGDISNAVANFVNSEAFEGFLDRLGKWMDNISAQNVADTLKLIVEGLIALKLAILGFEAVSAITDVLIGVQNFLSLFGEGGILAGVPTTIGNIAQSLTSLSPVLAAVAVLAAGLGAAFATNEDIQNSFSEAANTISENLIPLLELLTDDILPDLRSGWEKIKEVMSPLSDFISNVFVSIWQDMLNPALQYFGETILPMLTTTLSNLWNNILVPVGSFISSVLTPVIQFIADILNSFWQNILIPVVQLIGETIAEVLQGLFDILNETVIPIVQRVIDVGTFLWEEVLSPVVEFLLNSLQPTFETVFETIGGIIDGFKDILSGVINFITGIFTGDWRRAWEGVKDVFKGIFNGVISIVEGAVNFIINGINNFLNGFNGVVTSIGDVIGIDISIPNISKISLPRLAKGGLVTQTTIAEIGERGREAVLPLTNSIAMKDIANAISVPLAKSFQSINVNNYTAATPPTLPYQNYASIRNQAEMQSSNYEYSQGYSSGTESIIYNATYRAVSSALSNNKYFRDLCDDVAAGHTIEIDGQPMANVVKKKFNEEFKRTGRPAIEF